MTEKETLIRTRARTATVVYSIAYINKTINTLKGGMPEEAILEKIRG